MENKKTIELQSIDSKLERDILVFLNTQKRYFYGEIIRQLRISNAKGQVAIYSLINKGLIKQVENSSFIELNVDIK